jgi:hypothetical protein
MRVLPASKKRQENASSGRRQQTQVHMDNEQVNPAKGVSEHRYTPDICASDWFIFRWRKGKLQRALLTDQDQLSEAANESFTSLSVDMIEDVFQTRSIGWPKSLH